MAKQLFASLAHAVRARVPRPIPVIAGVVLLAIGAAGIWLAVLPKPATCQGICQCWYCPRYAWGDFDGDGVSEFRCESSCDHGCAGACTAKNACSQVPGQGGCGPVCGCRDSDCGGAPVPTGNPPTPVVTPEPTPPADCPAPGEVREWINLIPPKLNGVDFKPDRPVVVEQDPDKQGFKLHISGTGGCYEHKTQRLEKVCDDQPDPMPGTAGHAVNGTPQPCRAWHYECPIRCAECYNDPFAGIQVRMRLADSTMEWIQGELASRYTGAQPKEGLPRT